MSIDPSTWSIYPPLLSLYATSLTADLSPKGILVTASNLEPGSPSGENLVSTSTLLSLSPITGLLVIILTTPA